jgi:hypothetical protein
MPVKTSKNTNTPKKTSKKNSKTKKVQKKSKVVTQKAGGKKTTKKTSAKKKVQAKVTVKKVRKVRSFKVKLPNSEVYEGRFTGLTPYQAANKALSKWYRENKKSKQEILFSIRESTRGSKRLVYHYNGHREKLKIPVEYAIKSGDETRVITKNFKNKLTKIKKAQFSSLNLA